MGSYSRSCSSSRSAKLELVEVDQATSLDGLVAAVLVEREPVHLALDGVDDHQLVDVVGGVEGQLLPAVLVGRDDLDDQLDAGQPQGAVKLVGVVLGFAEVALSHRHGHPGAARRRAEQLAELLGQVSVGAQQVEVQDASPHLVVAVGAP